MTAYIGIDLGTTFSAAAFINEYGQPEIIPNEFGKPITPSVIYFDPEEGPVVGEEAKQLQAGGEANVASFFKRSMGDPHYLLTIAGQEYTPTGLSALILKKLKTTAETYLGRPVTQAVITAPAYFANAQREATIEAARKAGLETLRVINEPTAAALAYGLRHQAGEQLALVYDLGGGTFDVSIVLITPEAIEVKGTNGDDNLGGKDWDDRLVEYVAREFEDEFGIDLKADDETYHDLLLRAETAKKSLSQLKTTALTISVGRQRGRYKISRQFFEELSEDLLLRTRMLTELALAETGLTWQDITQTLLVGGSTRMPAVGRFIKEMSGKKPALGVNVDEAVALGAAVQAALDMQAGLPTGLAAPTAALLPAGQKDIQDVISHSLGLIALNGDQSAYLNSIVIPKNRPIPCRHTRPYKLRVGRPEDNRLDVYLTQGESRDPLACAYLGKYVFTGLPPVKKDTVIIDVTYAYDKSGVVNVAAVERATQKPLTLAREPLPDDVPDRFALPPDLEYTVEPLTVYLAFDLSGSMSGAPLLKAKEAAMEFLSRLDLSTTSMGLLSFADRFQTNIAACQDAGAIEKAIQGLRIGEVGYGNASTLFAEARSLLPQARGKRYIVVLTDGIWNNQARAIEEARQCHQDGIDVIAIGFGGADQKFLRAIASTDSLMTDLDNLVNAFSAIAQELTEGRLSDRSTELSTQ